MKFIYTVLFTILFFGITTAQNIYSKSYGDKQNPAIIFIHGGPSGNSNLFEGTTAQNLANKGSFVIVYDRRGEGRSKDENATMTFQESFEDLNKIYDLYKIDKANILAHSFGGIIGTLFTNQFPQKVNSLFLAGALFSQQETYNHILENAKSIYKNDSDKLSKIEEIESLDKNSAEYRKKTYDIASDLNYFTMPKPTKESTKLRSDFEDGIFYKTNIRNSNSPLIFYKNENQNNLDNKNTISKIEKNNIPVYAIYGKNDGIFSEKQLSDLKSIVGFKNFKILNNCSHYLFVDQQNKFLNFVTKKLK